MLLSTVCLAGELPLDERFPALEGEFLTGGKARRPEDCSGRVALLAFGFTCDSRFAVEDWLKRFRPDYGEDARATFYEIPMIGGVARLGKWFIDGGMKRGTPDREHVITVYGGVDPWKERFGFKAPDAAYRVLLARNGTVRWRQSGAFRAAPSTKRGIRGRRTRLPGCWGVNLPAAFSAAEIWILGSEYPHQLPVEIGDECGCGLPRHEEIDSKVIVNKLVAHTRDPVPRNAAVTVSQLSRNLSCRFADNRELADYTVWKRLSARKF